MYKEIHPFYYDATAHSNAKRKGEQIEEKNFFLPQDPITLRLDLIRQIKPIKNEKQEVIFKKLVISDDHQEDITISLEEAGQINKDLLKKGADESLAKELSDLTKSIRDLWNLLRARLH